MPTELYNCFFCVDIGIWLVRWKSVLGYKYEYKYNKGYGRTYYLHFTIFYRLKK